MKFFPFFYFPTTLYLVDDHPRFLSSVERYFSYNAAAQIFSNPDDFIGAIKASASKQRTVLRKILDATGENLEDDEPHEYLRALLPFLRGKERFRAAAVAMIDYSMPAMTGLDVCAVIPTEIKRILLTGEADHAIAVKAFNHGSIQRFIMKDDPQLPEALQQAFFNLTYEFFEDLSKPLWEAYHKRLPAFIRHPEFKPLFREQFAAFGGVEFYLLTQDGDYLCLNDVGQAFLLSFRDEKQLANVLLQVEYEHLAEPLPQTEAVVAALRRKEVLCFLDFPLPGSTWTWQTHQQPLTAHHWAGGATLYSTITPLAHETFTSVFGLAKFLEAE
jgi:CheY-like chemotaxis protein